MRGNGVRIGTGISVGERNRSGRVTCALWRYHHSSLGFACQQISCTRPLERSGSGLVQLARFRGERTVSQRTVGPDGVVVHLPPLNEYLRFQQCLEDLPVEQFNPQLSVERLDIAVLSGRSRLDEQRPHADSIEPITDFPCGELRTVNRSSLRSRTTRHFDDRSKCYADNTQMVP